MKRGIFYMVLTFSFIFSGCANKKPASPNIILVMTDDQGWFDAGFNGNNTINTPNLDMLAREGIVLKRFYSASAVCSPTRASVITGRNPNRMGIPNANTGHMKKQEITLPEILKQRGYSTGHFGKWHLGILTKNVKDANRGGREKHFQHYSIPTMHGYDTFFCTESKVPTYDPMIHPAKFDSLETKRYGWFAVEENEPTKSYGTFYWKSEEKKETKNLEGDDSRVIMDRVIPFIDKAEKDNKPFFSTIWFHTPHLPVVADIDHRDLYAHLSEEEQIYYGTISAMDEQMGRLWNHLKEKGIANNTMIWFCSDNGPERRTPGSAGEFRERKRSLYEGGVRVPAFVVWKDVIPAGNSTEFPMVTSDYLPTILDFLNFDYPDEQRPLDGISLKDALLEKAEIRKTPIGFMYGNKISWVTNEYKLISTDSGENYELYNLLQDKSELNDISDQNPEKVDGMKKELNNWMISVRESNEGKDY